MLILNLFASLTLTAASANGNRVGNGGKGVVCLTGDRKNIQLLDLYESALKPNLDLKGTDRDEILQKVFKNLERLAPRLAAQYRKRLDGFLADVEFRDAAELTATTDSFELSLPKDRHCILEQLAIRRTQTDGLTKPFLFSNDLWKAMDAHAQASLVLHEIVYEHFWKFGEKDSVKARKMVAYLMSEQSTQDTTDKFWNWVQSLKVPLYR